MDFNVNPQLIAKAVPLMSVPTRHNLSSNGNDNTLIYSSNNDLTPFKKPSLLSDIIAVLCTYLLIQALSHKLLHVLSLSSPSSNIE